LEFYLQPAPDEAQELTLSTSTAREADEEARSLASDALRAAAALNNPVCAKVCVHHAYSITLSHADGVFASKRISLPADTTLAALREAVAAAAAVDSIGVSNVSLFCVQAKRTLPPQCDEDDTLRVLGLPDGAIDVQVIPPRAGTSEVLLQTPAGSVFRLHLHLADDTVDVISRWVRDVLPDLAEEDRHIIYAGKQLEDGRLLSDYKVQQGSMLHSVAYVARRHVPRNVRPQRQRSD
jgi:ubiquitin C